ncbi:MAG: hypothetical protein AMXMBFR84_36970 [Candidatus Hydrogenedentota bacterium]
MSDKRTILIASVTISIVAHGLLLIAAPHVDMLGASASPVPRRPLIHVQLVDDVLARNMPGDSDDSLRNLATRPGTIADLLSQQTETLTPSNPARVEIPRLTERIVQDPLPLPPSPETDEGVLRQFDSKIIEISESLARENVEVARRLVQPGLDRIVATDEDPVLRTPATEMVDEVLFIDPLKPGIGLEGPGGTVKGETGSDMDRLLEYPAKLEPIPEALEPVTTLPELPVDRDVVRSRVMENVKQERQYVAMDEFVEMRLDAFIPPGEKEGFFRLRIVPKDGNALEALPKDVTFVIDASSSILQRKLDETVAGVGKLVNGLKADDRFNVVVFRDNPSQFHTAPVAATPENKKAALEFIGGLQARGETDIYQAMQPAILTPPRNGIPGIVLVMSDGRPTKGIKDGREIINALTQENALRNSIFAFSGGRTVNQFMLDLLAYRNKGECKVVPQVESMASEMQSFFGQLSDPLLVNCKADYGRIDEDSVFPKNLPDFYRGQAVTIYGRFDPTQDHSIAVRLSGVAGDVKKEAAFAADLRQAQSGDAEIARMWAFRKIYDLIGEIVRQGEDPKLLTELRELGRTYNIRTSYD